MIDIKRLRKLSSSSINITIAIGAYDMRAILDRLEAAEVALEIANSYGNLREEWSYSRFTRAYRRWQAMVNGDGQDTGAVEG